MIYIDDIEKFTDDDNVFAFGQNSDEYSNKKEIVKLFLGLAKELMTIRQREVYSMRYDENLSHDEIAKKLGISAINSKIILHRANKKVIRVTNLIEKLKFAEREKE